MWPTIAKSGFASAAPIRATEEPSASLVVTSANEAASRQTSLAGPS